MKRFLLCAAMLLILCGCASEIKPTVPSSAETPPAETTSAIVSTPPQTTASTVPPETTVPETTAPAATEPPVTTVPANYVGTLYTREQLEAMDSTLVACGTGSQKDESNRPLYSISLEEMYSKYDAHFIAPDNGKVCLTFTLGYEYENLTASILDTLKEKNVKGIFIINMHYAKSCPELVQRMIDEGHIVGNHSSGHYTLPELSIDRVVEEIMELHNYMLENFGYKMTVFRPPSGYFSERVLAIAQSLGYTTLNYSFAYADWETANQPNPAESMQRMIDCAHSGAIYQLHTVSATNAQILGDVIDAIRAKGLEFDLYC